MATHSSILAWEILWTEEPGGLQSLGSQRVRKDLVTELACSILLYIYTVSSLSIHLPVNTKVASLSWLLQISTIHSAKQG